MGEEELEKTAVWVSKYLSSLIVVAQRWRREEPKSEPQHYTRYEIILFDEKKERGKAQVLSANEALSLAAFILLTADCEDMSDDYRRKLREAAREVLSGAKYIRYAAVIPEDVREGW
jgi:hypothetical protein